MGIVHTADTVGAAPNHQQQQHLLYMYRSALDEIVLAAVTIPIRYAARQVFSHGWRTYAHRAGGHIDAGP